MNTDLPVGDIFVIRGRGLVIVPREFRSILLREHFAPIAASFVIVRPDGSRAEYAGSFRVEHFSLSEGGTLSVIALLPSASREDVPEGSSIQVEAKTVEAVRALVTVS